MRSWTAAAVRNNADWCDLVCRSHGARTTFDGDGWSSATRTPPFYPDAITLHGAVDATDLLARIDGGAGCSVKDSYATLDLGPFGFRVLFDAEWIVKDSPTVDRAGGAGRWERLRPEADLASWEAAWQGGGHPIGLFLPALLHDDRVTMLACYRDDAVVAGAVLNVAAGVVGISNHFARSGAGERAWHDCVSAAHELFPNVPLVGYESGARLDEAIESGFDRAGPLRVWVHDG